ncbi:MAG: virulence factor SrfB, partial [Succinivibrionaceae bacterium]|nr:virulence factor SrfB [Succinivibrionaceae bacterium]
CIPVHLILDIGNSRTCGVLVEGNNPLNKSFLCLRNLTNPLYVYDEPFSSCVEFAKTSFVDLPIVGSVFDSSSFAWTSMVRTGFEAESLTFGKNGNEGNTGLSSPKRYLWDEEIATTEWRLNNSLEKYKYLHASSDNLATIAPIISYVNDKFEATFGKVLSKDTPDYQKMSAFSPKGSRCSMMTMLIIEILSHAISQINSYASRKIKEKADEYRYLDSIILTVPPAMPKQEIKIYNECVHQAIGILWKALKWDPSKDDHNSLKEFLNKKSSKEEIVKETMWPCFPEIKVDWDEAMCGQICYLYNEIAHNYKGNVKNFFNAISSRNWCRKNDKCITLATIDIGGGTTDLVINRYEPENISDKSFIPVQMFKESFKIAGDDIVLQIIRMYVIPAIIDYAVKLGANKSDVTLLLKEKLGGSSSDKVLDRSLKRLFTRQILNPIALDYLSRYEDYDPISSSYENETAVFEDLIEKRKEKYGSIDYAVFEYIEHDLNKLIGNEVFHVKDVPLEFKLNELHNNFATGRKFDICEKVFSYISEVLNSYICDVVIITGRPSRLPGVEACFKNYLNLPKDRIVSFNKYHFDNWYPYIKGNGYVDDPKTSAVVGATLCNLVIRGALNNFYLKVGNLKIKSNIKYLGQLDTSGEHLLNANVFYKEPLNFDDPNYKIPDDQEINLPPGCMTIGYRQLKQERWPAYPLYQLTIDEKVCNWLNSNANYSLSVVLERTENNDENGGNRYSDDGIKFKRIKPKSTGDLNNSALENDLGISDLSDVVKLKLCTMPNVSLGETTYWLDSGSVMLNV